MMRRLLPICCLAFSMGCALAQPDPLSIEELRARDVAGTLKVERNLEDGRGFSASLVSYQSDGLKVHALVAVPKAAAPEHGFPVVIANHGFHPDPPRYGITADGKDSRPGDYYRSVPELFTARGFLVVMPDYRGHSSSQGLDFVASPEASAYYAQDVLALLGVLSQLRHADAGRVFMWSHSMGGQVALRALLATDAIRAASFWSTASVAELLPRVAELGTPVLVQHAIDDQTTPLANSLALVESLTNSGRPVGLFTYAAPDHYFAAATRELAADRDAQFFMAMLASRYFCCHRPLPSR